MVRKKKQRRSDAVRQKTETAGSHRYSNVIAGMLLIGSFVLYLRNLCPTIYAGDSPTFSASAWLLGVSHPPGYPLFSVLGKLFCVLPLGDIGFRTNLGTAVLGSGAVAGMYFLGKNLGINRFWSGFAATLFAVTRVFWDQCLGAEVYTLHALLTVLVLSMLFSKLYFPRKVAAIAFLLGVSMTNHFMSLFLFAASGLWLVLEFMSLRETFPGKNILTGLKASFFLFLGLSLYLYLPLRAIHQPGINWGAPDTYEKTRDHITRKQYKQLEFGSPFTPDQIEKKYQERKDSFQRPDGKGFYSLAESKKAIEQIMLWEAKDKFLGHFFSELSSQFAWILVIPGLFGLYQLMKIRPREISSMAVIFVLNSVGLILMLKFPFDEIKRFVVTVYYIPCYLIFSLLVAVGMQWIQTWKSLYLRVLNLTAITTVAVIIIMKTPLSGWYLLVYPLAAVAVAWGLTGVCRGIRRQTFTTLVSWSTLVVVVVMLICWNQPKVTKRDHFITFRYGKDQLKSMEQNALAILFADSSCFPIRYLQEVCGYRRDVVIIRRNRLLLPDIMDWYWQSLNNKYGDRLGLSPVSDSLVYRENDLDVGLRRIDAIIRGNKNRYPIYALNNEVVDRPLEYRVSGPAVVVMKKNAGPVENTFFMDGLLERLLVPGDPALKYLLERNSRFWSRIGSWPHPPVIQQDNYLEKEILLNYAKSYSNFGTMLFKQGNWQAAVDIYENAYRLVPFYGTGMHNLGHLYHQKSLFSKAEQAYRRALAADSDLISTMNNLGVLLLDVKGEKEEARELFRQVIVRAPGTGVAKMAAANLQRLENMAPAPQK